MSNFYIFKYNLLEVITNTSFFVIIIQRCNMRLKNVKGANDIIIKGRYYVANPYEYKNRWSEYFNNYG